MPTVADRAVVSAWKWDRSPACSGSSYSPLITRMPWVKYLIWMKFSRRVVIRPVPTRITTSSGSADGQSHTRSLRVKIKFAITAAPIHALGAGGVRDILAGHPRNTLRGPQLARRRAGPLLVDSGV